MLIKWTGDGVLGLPQIAISKDGESKDLYTDMGNVVTILPGWNEITDEEWALAYPHIKDLLNPNTGNPYIEVYGKKVADGDTGESSIVGQAIEDVRADRAKEIVTNCFNVKVLERWDANMKIGTEIAHLIDKQLEACMNGEGPKKGRK
jgi:hypothetical protein